MCTTFYRKTNEPDIETVEQFEEYFGVNADDYSRHDELMPDACLCQIDTGKFLEDHPEVAEKYKTETGMDYWEQQYT